MAKIYYVLLGSVLFLSACSQATDNVELQQQSEQATEKYRQKLDADAAKSAEKTAYVLPKRAEGEEAPITLADLKNMTKPDDFVKALVTADPQVRLAAVKALYPFANNLPDAPLQRLINMLDAEKDKAVVAEVANILGQSCHPAVMVMLLNNLKRDTNTINIEAMNVLGNVGGYRAVEGFDQLLARLDDEQSMTAQQIRPIAQHAKDKILDRNGRPLACSW